MFNFIPCKHLRTYDIVRWYYLHPTKIIIFLLCSIEHCIEEIQFEVNKLCPDVRLQTTADCFKWLASYDYVSSKSPSISHGDLIAFLKIMVKKKLLFYGRVGKHGIQLVELQYVNVYCIGNILSYGRVWVCGYVFGLYFFPCQIL